MELRVKVEAVFEDGRREEHSLGAWRRSTKNMHPEAIGLLLEDAHALLQRFQKVAVSAQVEELSLACRACPTCGKQRPIHDYRTRVLDTLFGRLKVRAPRIKPCACQGDLRNSISSISPLNHLFPSRTTPELLRLEAELGARHSFREAERLMNQFLPCARQGHVTIRNRLGRVAQSIECKALQKDGASPVPNERIGGLNIFLDGAHIRCRPEYQ